MKSKESLENINMDNQNLVTIDLIMEWINKQIQDKQPIDVNTWLYVAERLNVLLQGEQEKLFEIEQEVALAKKLLLEDPSMSSTKAKVMVEATDIYKQSRIQKAKIERALETIRISKLHGRLSSDLMRSNI